MAETYGPYGLLLSSFFDGATGMRLQAAGQDGKDALLLGAFLTANEWANMIGLYELSLSKIARRLPVLEGPPVVMRAFALLDAERFAHYDEESEYVWVREMARVRLRIVSGQPLTNPKQLTGAQNCYQRLPLNPFLGPFYDRYHIELALKHRRQGKGERSAIEGQSNADRLAFEGQSIGNRSAIEGQSGSPQTPLQVPVLSTQYSEDQEAAISTQEKQPAATSNVRAAIDAPLPEEQPALTRRNPAAPGKLFRTLCAVSSEVLVKQAADIEDLGDYTERVKRLAATRQVDYSDRELLRSATDAALSAYRRNDPTFLQVPRSPRIGERSAEMSDPTLNVARGSLGSIGELADTLKTGNVDDFNNKVRNMTERRRA